MEKVFDIHQWQAETYCDQKSIYKAIKTFGIRNKKIKSVQMIGMAIGFEDYTLRKNAYYSLGIYDIPANGLYAEKNRKIENVLLPCEVEVCEPVVLTLEDDTTFEFMPCYEQGIKMSVGQISADICDGLNPSNFDSALLFEEMCGKTIEEIQTTVQVSQTYSGFSCTPKEAKYVVYTFGLSDGSKVYLKQEKDGWFRLGLAEGGQRKRLPYKKLKEATKPVYPFPLTYGDFVEYGHSFQIVPVRFTDENETLEIELIEENHEKLSLGRMTAAATIEYFWEKWFDDDFPYEDSPCAEERQDESSVMYAYDGKRNFYRYDIVRKIVEEMRQFVKALQTDFDSTMESYRGLWAGNIGFWAPRGISKYWDYGKEPTKAQEKQAIRDNLDAIVDYYVRFCDRLETMMENAPDCELLSVMNRKYPDKG